MISKQKSLTLLSVRNEEMEFEIRTNEQTPALKMRYLGQSTGSQRAGHDERLCSLAYLGVNVQPAG